MRVAWGLVGSGQLGVLAMEKRKPISLPAFIGGAGTTMLSIFAFAATVVLQRETTVANSRARESQARH